MLIQKTGSFLFCCQRNCVVLGDVYHALKFFLNFGCSGSWCFARAFSLVAVGGAGGYSWLQFMGFSLQGLLLQSTGSRGMGLSSCSLRAQ